MPLDPKEIARLGSEKFLWESKVPERHSMFMVEECIENKDFALTITQNTLAGMNELGLKFFISHN